MEEFLSDVVLKEARLARLAQVGVSRLNALVVGDDRVLPVGMVRQRPLGRAQVVLAIVLAARLEGAVLSVCGGPELLVPLRSVVDSLTDLVHMVSAACAESLGAPEELFAGRIRMHELS